ncbi:hypothetical protein [Anabaena sp. UHCC 0451]|nr:hypothetical protein [Anabaena sp. UHCC 0451]MEA5577467.1 hypothetical protein [Anabaena sp. UHCC 0451]
MRSSKIRVVVCDRCLGMLGCDSEARPSNRETVVQFNDVIQA